jgi:hypothetical protein
VLHPLVGQGGDELGRGIHQRTPIVIAPTRLIRAVSTSPG